MRLPSIGSGIEVQEMPRKHLPLSAKRRTRAIKRKSAAPFRAADKILVDEAWTLGLSPL